MPCDVDYIYFIWLVIQFLTSCLLFLYDLQCNTMMCQRKRPHTTIVHFFIIFYFILLLLFWICVRCEYLSEIYMSFWPAVECALKFWKIPGKCCWCANIKYEEDDIICKAMFYMCLFCTKVQDAHITVLDVLLTLIIRLN